VHWREFSDVTEGHAPRGPQAVERDGDAVTGHGRLETGERDERGHQDPDDDREHDRQRARPRCGCERDDAGDHHDGDRQPQPGAAEVLVFVEVRHAPERYHRRVATKPDVTIPAGAPPDDLKIEDLLVGTGTEATAGKTVDVHYVGVAWSTKQQFDASWDRGGTFSFQLGAGRVIKGWDQGVAGMKIGGRRRLTIPARLGYGERGAGRDIKPGETLVFVVDLLGVT